MTFSKIVWPVLMLALCGNAAYAQNKVAKKATQIERALQVQIAKQMKTAEKKAQVCKHCGEEIKHPYQHCGAQNSCGLCESAQQDSTAQQKQTYKAPQAPVVGEKCTICGEEVKHPYQHCKAKHGTILCETAPKDTTATKQREKFCSECGRTKAQVKIHGHNHKPPYIFQ